MHASYLCPVSVHGRACKPHPQSLETVRSSMVIMGGGGGLACEELPLTFGLLTEVTNDLGAQPTHPNTPFLTKLEISSVTPNSTCMHGKHVPGHYAGTVPHLLESSHARAGTLNACPYTTTYIQLC